MAALDANRTLFPAAVERSNESHVLLVEDDSILLGVMIWHLRQNGWGVDAALDGEHGLAMALRGNYDVIVLDHQLPALLGLDVLRRLRGQGLETPVVVISGSGSEQVAFAAAASGAQAYIAKPFDPRNLVRTISEMLATNRVRIREQPQAGRDAAVLCDGYARWTSAMLAAIMAANDPRTVDLWARCANASPGSLRGWCRTCGLPARRSLLLARILRAARLSRSLSSPVESFLNISDHRTLRRLLSLSGLDHPGASVDEILTRQQLVRSKTALQELEHALNASWVRSVRP